MVTLATIEAIRTVLFLLPVLIPVALWLASSVLGDFLAFTPCEDTDEESAYIERTYAAMIASDVRTVKALVSETAFVRACDAGSYSLAIALTTWGVQ